MFFKKKALVAFDNKEIFGNFTSGYDNAFAVVARLMILRRMNLDGTIRLKEGETPEVLNIADLWSYIYYLFYHNHDTIKDFETMKGENDHKGNLRASAENFYKVVADKLGVTYGKDNLPKFSQEELLYFITLMIQEHDGVLKNPFAQAIKDVVMESEKGVLSAVSLKTGLTPGVVKVVRPGHPDFDDALVYVTIKEVQPEQKIVSPQSVQLEENS